MGAIASQITSLTIVYSFVYSDADQRKNQSSASLAFVWGMFPFDDVIMYTWRIIFGEDIIDVYGKIQPMMLVW